MVGDRIHDVPGTSGPAAADGLGRHRRPLRMHQDSSQMQAFFNPSRGIRDEQARSGKQPTDHSRNNRTAIRELSQMNRVRKEMEAETEQVVGQRQFKARPAPVVGKAPSGRALRPGERDFLNENARDAALAKKAPEPTKADEKAFLNKDTYGKVPMYLQERKIELAAEKAMKAAEKEMQAIPPGMRVLGEQERLETLDLLAQDREQVESQLRKMPFVVETPTLIKQKQSLEERLKEIDEAVRMFSRPRVLVRAMA